MDGRLTTTPETAETEQQEVGAKGPQSPCFANNCYVVDVNEQSQPRLTGDSDRQTLAGGNAVMKLGKDAQGKETDIEDIATKTPVSLLEKGLDNPALEKDPDTEDNITKETPVSLLEKGLDNPALDKDSDHEHLTTEEARTCVDHRQALSSSTVVTAVVECGFTHVNVDSDLNQYPKDYTGPSVERSESVSPCSETVVTAVVEYVDKDDDDVLPVSESTSRPDSVLGMTDEERSNVVALNTVWLASGDILPSLPPPVVVPIDEPNGLTNDGFDKASTDCVLEMKILQKSEPGSGSPPGPERCDSQMSTLSDKTDICRICHCEGEENNKLISPCLCSGSLKYLHLACLQKWIKSSDKKACELCNFDYIMSSKTRPFKEWEKLEMTHNERRKVVCSVTFHIIAITCVIWSLYVLIDRTTEEVHLGTLDWPFWTKLIVVTIGFTGGMIFMYVQCKMYVHLCARWRSFNKLITIENAPEDPQLRAEAAARIKDKAGEERGVVNTVALQEIDSL